MYFNEALGCLYLVDNELQKSCQNLDHCDKLVKQKTHFSFHGKIPFAKAENANFC